MTPHQFWEEDQDLFYAYQKAYINRIHNENFVNGRYFYDALTIVLSNAFKGKNDPPTDYYSEDVYNPFKSIKNGKKSYINTLDCSKSNTSLYHLKEKFKRKE